MSEIILSPESRSLGKSGIPVSPIAWGMWRFGNVDAAGGRVLVEAALAAGVTLFDTADIYGFDGTGGFGDAEALLGAVFAATPGLRDKMVLATKGGITPPVPYDSGRDYLMAALEHSLRRLRVDHVDLYQIHPARHPDAPARTGADARRHGRVGQGAQRRRVELHRRHDAHAGGVPVGAAGDDAGPNSPPCSSIR